MKPSKLQLDHYSLTSIHIESIECEDVDVVNGYPNFDHAKFSSSIEFEPSSNVKKDIDDGIERYTLELTLEAYPKSEESPKFPARLKISAIGIFHGPRIKKEDRDVTILVNGASLLYGAMRETVLSLTSRMPFGAILLPTVSFSSIAEDYEKQKSEHIEASKPGNKEE